MLFFFNDTATTEIYTLSLHDALPIYLGEAHLGGGRPHAGRGRAGDDVLGRHGAGPQVTGDRVDLQDADRKSTRLNSSHANISYAVFCLKQKKSPSAAEGDSCYTPSLP